MSGWRRADRSRYGLSGWGQRGEDGRTDESWRSVGGEFTAVNGTGGSVDDAGSAARIGDILT